MDSAKILAMEKQREQERKARRAEMDRVAEESRKPKVCVACVSYCAACDARGVMSDVYCVSCVNMSQRIAHLLCYSCIREN